MPTNVVNISEVIVHGIVFDPKNSKALRTMDLENLLKSIPGLFDLLEQRNIDYVLVGGIAMLVYVEGRNTQDIDVIVAADGPECLPEIEIEDRNPEFARGRLGDLRVDLLFSNNKLFDKVRREHTVRRQFVERQIPCATVEGLLLLKLFVLPLLYRQDHFARALAFEGDVTDLIYQYGPEMPKIFDELANHVLPSDLGEIRNIVQEIEGRITRSRQRFGNGQ